MKKSIVMLMTSIMLITTFTISIPIKNCEADPYEQIKISMIKRSDGSIVPEEYTWREEQKIYLLDNQDSSYQIIFSNTTDENKNVQETTTEDNGLFWVLILLLTIFCIFFISFINIILIRRKKVTNIIIKGNEKIKELDKFLQEIKIKKD